MYLGGFCFITDISISNLPYTTMVALVLQSEAKWIQLRNKESSRDNIYRQSIALRQLTKKHDAVFIVNDYADIAQAVDADGVHLGQEDLPIEAARNILGKNRIIGISTHNLKQAVDAEKAGADYIGFGPVFHTTTKDAGSPKGLEALKEITQNVRIPVVAIGGFKLDNVEFAFRSGAQAVAVSSGVLSGDIERNTRGFLKHIRMVCQKADGVFP